VQFISGKSGESLLPFLEVTGLSEKEKKRGLTKIKARHQKIDYPAYAQ
jgi:hypothetical protein